MQITMIQSEIETVVRDHVLQLLKLGENKDIAVDLSATRGATGFTATEDEDAAESWTVVEASS